MIIELKKCECCGQRWAIYITLVETIGHAGPQTRPMKLCKVCRLEWKPAIIEQWGLVEWAMLD